MGPPLSVRALALCGLALGSLAGCATTTAGDEELARVRRDVHALRGELAETKAALQLLEGQLTLLAASTAARPVAAAAPPAPDATPIAAAPPGRPSLPVVRLEGAAPPAKSAARAGARSRDPDGGAIDDGSPPILIQLGPNDVGERLTVDKTVLDKPDPVLGTKGARATEQKEKVDYDAALAALRSGGSPAEARRLFEAFRTKYPRSSLQDNAAYWLAECSFAESQYARAIEELAKLIADRPSASKVPDALLLTAESWLKLGKAKEAEEVLRRLIKSHPNSAARATADKRLADLGAT